MSDSGRKSSNESDWPSERTSSNPKVSRPSVASSAELTSVKEDEEERPSLVPETAAEAAEDEEDEEVEGDARTSIGGANAETMTDGGDQKQDSMMAKRKAYEERKAAKKQRDEELQAIAASIAEEEEEEDDPSALLDRRDSELTSKQIVEKDIMWYDMLLANEELCELPSMKKKTEKTEEEEDEEEEYELDEEEEEKEEAEEETPPPEEEEEEEEEEDEPEPDGGDQDDPDNIVNLMMQSQDEAEDDVMLLFKADFAGEQEADTFASQEGIIGIELSDETKKFLEIEPEITDWRDKWVWVSTKRMRLHIYIYEDKSEFQPHYKAITQYPDFAMLLGIDFLKQTGHQFFLCVTPEARNFILNPIKKRKVVVDLKKKEEEAWDKLASIVPRKWRSLGSEVEVEAENIHNSRPLLKIHAYRYAEHFNATPNFSDAKFPPNSASTYTFFESKDPSKVPGIERIEVDKAVQVNPPKISQEAQTGFSFKRNKMVQHEVQAVPPDEAEIAMKTPEFHAFIKHAKTAVEKALQQNEMLNIMSDDYRDLRAVKGHEVEFNNESVLLQEYQTYSELRHSKGRCVTHMAFHPLLDELLIMAFTEDVTFDKKIEYHSKLLMDPNFVLLWDLKDPSKPQLMLDAPSDVNSFMVSPSDPNLICGGCENGQIVLWDLGRHYVEIQNRIQDRKKKESDANRQSFSFLEKLKDSTEKYCCPLLQPAGLSNLDSSHKRAVFTVHWLPPHVEMAKNGNLYENTWGGRSAQFFSVAGDSSIRVWDIRLPRMGLEEFDLEPSSAIKQNPWHHLENNTWKHAIKYSLDDGSGSMFCTLISLSEAKIGDILIADDTIGGQSSVTSIGEGGGSSAAVSSSHGSGSGVRSKSKARTTHSALEAHDSKATSSHSVEQKSGSGPTTGKSAHTRSAAETEHTDSGTIGSGSGVKRQQGGGPAGGANAAKTSFFAGTETGHVALVDWLRNKDGSINPDSSGNKVCANIYIQSVHDGSITSIRRSPFHHELILVVGGGTVSIWKENSAFPILATHGGENFSWCGTWSNTRPAVFFCGTREGCLQVWDLMEKCHMPVLTQQISPGRIMGIAVPKTLTQKKHFLAAGDSQGNLFVMLIPRYYTKPKHQEDQYMLELMNREETRMAGWVADAETRDDRIKAINEAFKESRTIKTEKEILEKDLKQEARMEIEYNDFLEFQSKVVAKLKREEPSLPTEEVDLDAELDALIAAAEDKEQERLRSEAEAAALALTDEGNEEEQN